MHDANNNNKTNLTSKQAIMNMMDANAYGNIHEDGMHKVRKTNNTSMMMQQFIMTIMETTKINRRHLEHRSRGITTLHHYERISSRDLGWHQREKEEEEKR